MSRYVTALVAAVLVSSWSEAAQAEDVDFGYSYGAETTDAGETEVELWATERHGKGEGHYGAQDYRLEVERGITDRFQVALYANFAGHHVHRMEPRFEDIDRSFGFQGLSAEFQYNLIKPTHDGFGLTLYAEPGWSRINHVSGETGKEYELELKAIVQKNFSDDRLVWVGNLTVEPEWEREDEEGVQGVDEPDWEKELKIELTTGLAYRVAPGWSVGIEGRYSNIYPDWTEGMHREAFAVSAGPTVHYSSGEWSMTATWLPQLFGSPNGSGSNLSLDEYEKSEFRLKLSHEF